MLEAFGHAWLNFLDPNFLLFVFLGLMAGIVVGVIPGISVLFGYAVFFPFVFYLPAEEALCFMMGMLAVSNNGGAVTTVLAGIPGDSTNVATLLDGFPMAQKGEPGRALGISMMASVMGDVYTVCFALLMIPLAYNFVMSVTSSELFFVIMLGLVLISTLSRGSMVKGLISGALGLLLSLFGSHIVTGVARFTGGSTYLYEGIPLVPTMMGLFALPVMIELSAGGGTISVVKQMKLKGYREVWHGVTETFRYWRVNLLSSVIGYCTGIIPGVGAAVSQFVCYGIAKQTSKHPELFGTGYPEGIVASESANDAKHGGSLLTTLALGIPASSTMALMLGAFLILGLKPGPEMLTTHLDLSFMMIITILVAAVVAAIIIILSAPWLTKLCFIPARYMVPLTLIFIFIGAYNELEVLDWVTMVIFAGIGIAMDKFGFNRPTLILGFFLGNMFEKYFWLALMSQGPLFFLRPVCLVLVILSIFFLGLAPARNAIGRRLQRRLAA